MPSPAHKARSIRQRPEWLMAVSSSSWSGNGLAGSAFLVMVMVSMRF
jgi:hypothetical protein